MIALKRLAPLALSCLVTTGTASAAKPALMKPAGMTAADKTAPALRVVRHIGGKTVILTPAEAAANPVHQAQPAQAQLAAEQPVALSVAKKGNRFTRAMGAIGRVVMAPARALKSFTIRTLERRAAMRDYKHWLKHEDNKDIATFYKGARADHSIGMKRFELGYWSFNYGLNLVTANVSMAFGLAPVAALSGGLTVYSALNLGDASRSLRMAHIAARNDTIDYALNNQGRSIAQARLDRWAKAGLIDTKLAEKDEANLAE